MGLYGISRTSWIMRPNRSRRSASRWACSSSLFLLVGFVLAYLLKKEYWKDVH